MQKRRGRSEYIRSSQISPSVQQELSQSQREVVLYYLHLHKVCDHQRVREVGNSFKLEPEFIVEHPFLLRGVYRTAGMVVPPPVDEILKRIEFSTVYRP